MAPGVVRPRRDKGMTYKRILSGGQGRNRTTDTRIFSPLLYRLSYLAFRDAPGAGARKQRRDYKVKCHPGQANKSAHK